MTERIVKFILSAEADGGENIRALAAEVEKLAAEGGSAAPAFKKLGEELSGLSQQQSAITQFAELKQQLIEAKTAFEQTAAATSASATSLRERKSALDAAAAAEQKSSSSIAQWRADIDRSRAALTRVKADLVKYKAEVAESGNATDEQRAAISAAAAEIRKYNVQIAATKASISALAPAQKENAAALKSASAAMKAASSDFERNRAAAASAKGEYERINASIEQTRRKVQELGIASNNLVASQLNVKSAVSQATQEVEKLRDSAGKTGGAFSSLATFAKRGLGQVTAVLATLGGATEFVRVNVELENVSRTLRIVTGSSGAAAKEMEFLRDVSNRLGLDLIETSKAYAQFAASTKGTALEGEKTRFVFESVTRAMSAAGKSAADTSSALKALAQMVSKGTVSMEDLRGQLGESLPGALALSAKGLGITTAELIKMVSQGRVLAVDLLPKLSDAINEIYKESETAGLTLGQQWEKFRNAITDTFADIGSTGILQQLFEATRVGATAAAVSVNSLVLGYSALMNTLRATASTVADFTVSLATLNFDGFADRTKKTFSDMANTIADKWDGAIKSIKRFADQSTTLKDAINLVSPALNQTAAETKRLEEANTRAAKSAEGSTQSWQKLNVTYDALRDATSVAIKTAERSVIARKAEADAAVATAQAFGTEIQQRKAAADASALVQASLEKEAQTRIEDLALMESQLIAMEKWRQASGDASKERQEEIDKLKEKIAIGREDADQAIAKANISRIATEQAKAEAAAHADNSARLGELRDAYAQAMKEVDRLRLAKLAGKDVTEQLSAAELKASKAAFLYRDAIKDQRVAIEANLQEKQAQLDLSESLVRLQLEEARTDAEVARVKGDERAERHALNRVRELEIELAQLQANAARAEAEAALELVRVKREELQARGELTKVAEAELKAQEAAAQAKKVQADIADETANRLKRVKTATDEVARGSEGAADGVERLSDSLSSAAGNAGRLASGLRMVNGSLVNQDGWVTDAQGNVLSATSRPDPTQDANGNWSFVDGSGQWQKSQNRRPVQDANGNWVDPVMKAQMDAMAQPRGPAPLAGGGQLATFGGAQRPVRHEVKLTLGRRSRVIETATDDDAQGLVEFMRALETDMSRYSR